MKKQKLKKMNNKITLSKPVLLGALGFSIILLLGVLQIQDGIFSPQPVPKPIPTYPPLPPKHVVYNSPTPNPDCETKTFTSTDLGISFNYVYPNCTDPQRFFTKQIGNTVYLYDGSLQPFTGTDADFLKTIAQHSTFFVKVFYKDPNLTLTDAIKQKFLSGYSENDCFIDTSRFAHHPRIDTSLETALITIFGPTPIQNLGMQEWNERMAKCPAGYTYGGVSNMYFMMDPKHPNKFLFIQLVDGNIASGIQGYTWDESIKILQ